MPIEYKEIIKNASYANYIEVLSEYFYKNAKTFFHDERRRRKLLVKKRELSKLIKNRGREGMTLIPLKLYFNQIGLAKVLLGVGKGKKLVDKRQTDKKRDWEKQQGRILRAKGK